VIVPGVSPWADETVSVDALAGTLARFRLGQDDAFDAPDEWSDTLGRTFETIAAKVGLAGVTDSPGYLAYFSALDPAEGRALRAAVPYPAPDLSGE
jgi:hypothetical protein